MENIYFKKEKIKNEASSPNYGTEFPGGGGGGGRGTDSHKSGRGGGGGGGGGIGVCFRKNLAIVFP